MNGKKQSSANQTIVHTISVGPCSATIELKASNTGYTFLTYRLERGFVTSTNRKNKSGCFFESNEQSVIETVRAASAWIRANANDVPAVERPVSQPTDSQ
jgi:hypothetical protein